MVSSLPPSSFWFLDSYPNESLARGLASVAIHYCLGSLPSLFLFDWGGIPSLPVCFDFAKIPSPSYLWTALESQGPPLGCRVDQQRVVFSHVPHVPHCKRSRAFKGEAQLSLGFSCLGSFPLCPKPLPPRLLTLYGPFPFGLPPAPCPCERVIFFKITPKWMQHRDFPGGHPSQYYSGPKALNFRVLMGSGVVALV